jgi:hypothetical protein
MKPDTTVLDYYLSVYLPQHVAGRRMCARMANQFGTAIDKLEKFAGEKVRCSVVNAGFLRGFEVWCKSRFKGPYVSKYVVPVRRVVWHWNPKQFAYASNQLPHFSGKGVPGTLDDVFCNQFAVGRRIQAQRTFRQYGSTLCLFAEQLERPALLEDLTEDRLAAFAKWLVVRRGNTIRTATNHMQRMAALWNWAARNGLSKAPVWWRVASTLRNADGRRRAT